MPAETVDSAGDDRVKNNVMRHEYRVLSDEEKAQMKKLKDKGLEFSNLLCQIGKIPTNGDYRFSSRELSLAQTKIEEAVMWAVKHLTK